jgi:hypothetical protein
MNPEQKPPVVQKPPVAQTTAPVTENEMYALARTVVDETYNSTVVSINTGFALAAALAWNDSVKIIIQKFIKSNTNMAQMHLVYALVVTLLSTLVFIITKRFVKPSVNKTTVTPVLLR